MEEDLLTLSHETGERRKRACRWCRLVLALIFVPSLIVAIYLWSRFSGDVPVDYAKIEDQFKYGSTGGEHETGFPYWIWQAMPQVCSEHLPGKGYASLGLLYEKNSDGKEKDLPIGVSKRNYQGIDRVFLNCAACHTSTLRDKPGSAPRYITGMPANTFNIMAFEKFFFRCGADPKFTSSFIIPEIQRLGADLDLLDRYVIYPVAISIMRDRVLTLAGRFNFVNSQPDWGPGRVDTFNSAKVIFNFPMNKLHPDELDAPADFPSIWNQRPRKKRDDGEAMQLHWDGNNSMVEERNKSAAFGTGTTPPTIDLHRIGLIEDWLLDTKPPRFNEYFVADSNLVNKGAGIYKAYCASCHGVSGSNFSGEYVGKITPWEQIQTDRRRLDSYTYDLAVNQGTLYAGYPWRFQHFRKTFGYANMPLDGLWLRAPYLHNGSVPTLRDLLEPSANRPKVFYRGDDLYDPVKVGFVSDVAEENGRKYFKFDTATEGNSNAGHEGKQYGTELLPDEKTALVEFLKTF
ncbi:MAG: cytochrome c [Pseudomonadota bacterium]